MLTIFGTPKPFKGHVEIIQRNAIQSWKLLHPDCQVILAGNEHGTKEAAEEFGAYHLPNIKVNQYGTPLENSVLHQSEDIAIHSLMCIIASDIILTSDFIRAIQIVDKFSKKFIVFSQRWNLSVTKLIDFTSSWEDTIKDELADRGRMYTRTGVDYVVYPRGLFGKVPPFAVGRRGYDNWLLRTAKANGADLVDVTPVVKSVHQDHDYSYHPDGVKGVMYGDEARINTELVGSRSQRFMIKDRTHILTSQGVKRAFDFWRAWRFIRTFEACYENPSPLVACPVKLINYAVDTAGRGYLLFLKATKIKPAHELTKGQKNS